MNKKNLIFVLGIFLLSGVLAQNSVSNIVGINLSNNVVAGGVVVANLNFDYLNDWTNFYGSPLIIKLNITSVNNNYPVMKGDFVIDGIIDKKWLFNMLLYKMVPFICNESYNQTITHSLGVENVTAEDGVFYCYSENGDLNLKEHDDIYLYIRPNYLIYPGDYNMSAELFYLGNKPAPVPPTAGSSGGGGGGKVVSTEGSTCVPNWNCSAWSDCVNGTQTRDCVDTLDCSGFGTRPKDVQDCGNKVGTNETGTNETGTDGGFFSGVTGAVIGGGAGSWIAGVFVLLVSGGGIFFYLRKRKFRK